MPIVKSETQKVARITRLTSGAAPDITLHGNKGARLIEAAGLGLPIPDGFVIHSTLCREYLKNETKASFLTRLRSAVYEAYEGLGAPLVSVRSSGSISMPGAMESILNVGMNPETNYAGTGIPAKDCWARLFNMWAEVVGEDELPADPREQVFQGVLAVFRSWLAPTAMKYREINGIAHDAGTACVVQRMVFSNQAGGYSGVAHSRDPSTGEAVRCAEFVSEAQGEDLVNGKHVAHTAAGMWWAEGENHVLGDALGKLEEHYRSVREVEFTFDGSKMWILQDRAAKLSAPAAFKISNDLFSEGTIDESEALARVTPAQWVAATSRKVNATVPINTQAVAASPGIAAGVIVNDSEAAVAMRKSDPTAKIILHRPFTEMSDIDGMAAADGIVTETGSTTCHAAVVARSMNKPCVVAAGSLAGLGEVTIDGATGEIWAGVMPIETGSPTREMKRLLEIGRARLGAWVVGDSFEGFEKQIIAANGMPTTELITELEAASDAGATVVVDLNSREERLESDLPIGQLFGTEKRPTGKAGVEALIAFSSGGGSMPMVMLPPSKARDEFAAALIDHGVKVIEPAATLADIIDGDGSGIVPDALAKELGGWDLIADLGALMANSGSTVIPGPMLDPEEIVARTFGGV